MKNIDTELSVTPRDKALRRLDQLSADISLHLFKLVCCDDPHYRLREHFLRRLNGFSQELYRLSRPERSEGNNFDGANLLKYLFDYQMGDFTLLTLLAHQQELKAIPSRFHIFKDWALKYAETIKTGEPFNCDPPNGSESFR